MDEAVSVAGTKTEKRKDMKAMMSGGARSQTESVYRPGWV